MGKGVPWTEDQREILRQNYLTMQYKDLGVLAKHKKASVARELVRMGLHKKERPWSEEDLEYVAENVGLKSMEQMMSYLHRSRNGIKIIMHRKLHNTNQRSNIWTADSLAEDLGISCSKTVVAWLTRGYIVGDRAPFSYGPNEVWRFKYEDIIKCLEERPWLCRRERMPESYFRSIIQSEYKKNPWYTAKEAATFLGLADHNPIHRYIYQQLLPAVRRPMGGSKGEWIIRHKDLVEFQLHDPRPLHRKSIRLPETLKSKLDDVERRAWHALAQGHYQRFGQWAGVWVQLSSIDGRKPAPFKDLVELAKQRS